MKNNIALALNKKLPQTINKSIDGTLWLPLVPAGSFAGRDGRRFINSEPDNIVKSFNDDIIVDLDHQSELSINTQAAGWITQLDNRAGEVWGKVELNSLGKELIIDKRYKYYSSGWVYDKTTLVINKITTLGLTNKPNQKVPALNHQQPTKKPIKEQNMQQIMLALGLDASATIDQAIAAIEKIKDEKDKVQALNNRAPDMSQYVPKATFDQTETALNSANDQLQKLKTAKHQKDVDLALNAAIKDHKIAPLDKDYYRHQCMDEKGLESFRQFVSTKAPLIGPSPDFKKPTEALSLNSEHQAIAQAMGMSIDEYKGKYLGAK